MIFNEIQINDKTLYKQMIVISSNTLTIFFTSIFDLFVLKSKK